MNPVRTAITVLLYVIGCPAIVFGAASDIAGYPLDGVVPDLIFLGGVLFVIIGGILVSRSRRARR
ncbi:hypothetical protein [Actinoplanes sp. NPDC049265]|uniref:hypothetical protein n=1 Tax=Actinoplanes sp. NPDC049265 TaxID=3363902 RepID=UPI00370FA290